METHSQNNNAGRIPPQDIDAEKSLLGAILISSESFPEILEIIKPNDFYDKANSRIYQAMVSLYQNSRPIDLLTVTDELKRQKNLKSIGGAAYLAELTNFVPTSSHAKAYAEIVEKASVRRRLIKAGTEIVQAAYEDDAVVEDLVGDAEKNLFEVSDKSSKSDYTPLSDLVVTAFDRIENLHKNKGALRGLKTGFHDLDKVTAGLQKGDLIILGARPAMGKTTLAQNIAYNSAVINKRTTLFFSMEMSKDELTDRIISDVANIDSWKLRNAQLSDDDFAAIGNAMAEIGEAPLIIDDTSSLTALELRNRARRAAHDCKDLGLIVIDYLQLINGSDRYAGNRVQEITEISRSLKTLARELEIPVIALAQLNRLVTGRDDPRPVLSDLRDSGSIEQDADLVMMLHRPDYYKQNDDDYEETNIAELIIAKHRHGSVGKIELYFQGQYSRFMSLDKNHG